MSLIRSRSNIKIKVKSGSRSTWGHFCGEILLRGWYAFESNAFLLYMDTSFYVGTPKYVKTTNYAHKFCPVL